jgi:N utilization substance protein A
MEDEAILQLSKISGVEDAIAKALYRQGFRAPEEVAEATTEELAQIQGIGTAEQADSLKVRAEQAIEEMRHDRIAAAAAKPEALTDREKLLLVRGISERSATMLEEHGYRTLDDVLREDEDRLAIRTGLDAKLARSVRQHVQAFLDNELSPLDAARREAAEKRAELARAEADAAAAAAAAEAES